MKTLVLASAILAAQYHQKGHAPALISVVASNPVFGHISEPTLQEAETVAKNLTGLDPICFAIPQLCEARYANTLYTGFYSDGSSKTLRP